MAAIASAARRGLSAQQLRIWAESEAADDCLDHYVDGLGWLVTGHDGRPLGFGIVRPGRLPHLAALYVDPAAQGRGLGSALLQVIETRLRMRGMSRIATSVCDASAGFYTRHGYHAGYTVHYRWSQHDRSTVLTFLHLSKRLSPAARIRPSAGPSM